MTYEVKFMPEAIDDITSLKRTNIPSYNKIMNLIGELHEHPRTGTGKPELMKYGNLKGLWSRRVTGKDRLVYRIDDDKVIVLVL
ncbi:MAG: Txe/YoeB family addiction module toxin, partial [Dysgonamonadaceae bacterium]|nr:Txe/YoeB family addiction module toxin [Dysgonamonadaceae bacterium]